MKCCYAWILVAFWPNAGDGRRVRVGWGWHYFPPLLAEEDQVALTGSTPLVVCCIVPATVRCKGVEIIAGEVENQESSRLSFLVKTDVWLYKPARSAYPQVGLFSFFFSIRNSVFLSQQFSQNSVSHNYSSCSLSRL